MAKAAQERKGVLFIGLARVASRWKRFPEKVVPSDESMVSPAWASDHPVTNTTQYSRWTKKPRQCTDAIHRRPVELSGAEDSTLGVVLYDLNITVEWTTKSQSKCRFIRCWSNWFGASLYDLNAIIGWTTGQGVRSSSAEGAEPWPLL
jgi:hypothetical protein